MSSRKSEISREYFKDALKKGQKWYGPNKGEDIKKRWQEYTELYKKDLHDADYHNSVITQLEFHHLH